MGAAAPRPVVAPPAVVAPPTAPVAAGPSPAAPLSTSSSLLSALPPPPPPSRSAAPAFRRGVAHSLALLPTAADLERVGGHIRDDGGYADLLDDAHELAEEEARRRREAEREVARRLTTAMALGSAVSPAPAPAPASARGAAKARDGGGGPGGGGDGEAFGDVFATALDVSDRLATLYAQAVDVQGRVRGSAERFVWLADGARGPFTARGAVEQQPMSARRAAAAVARVEPSATVDGAAAAALARGRALLAAAGGVAGGGGAAGRLRAPGPSSVAASTPSSFSPRPHQVRQSLSPSHSRIEGLSPQRPAMAAAQSAAAPGPSSAVSVAGRTDEGFSVPPSPVPSSRAGRNSEPLLHLSGPPVPVRSAWSRAQVAVEEQEEEGEGGEGEGEGEVAWREEGQRAQEVAATATKADAVAAVRRAAAVRPNAVPSPAPEPAQAPPGVRRPPPKAAPPAPWHGPRYRAWDPAGWEPTLEAQAHTGAGAGAGAGVSRSPGRARTGGGGFADAAAPQQRRGRGAAVPQRSGPSSIASGSIGSATALLFRGDDEDEGAGRGRLAAVARGGAAPRGRGRGAGGGGGDARSLGGATTLTRLAGQSASALNITQDEEVEADEEETGRGKRRW
jgi:hypothetical protein